MTILSADLESKRQDAEIISYGVIDADTIYKGSLVVDATTGYASPGTPGSGYVFLGVAMEKVANESGAAGAINVRLYKTGSFVFSKRTTAETTDIGQPMYCVDDQTVDVATPTNSMIVGYVVSIPDSSHVRIRIDRAVQ